MVNVFLAYSAITADIFKELFGENAENCSTYLATIADIFQRSWQNQ